MDYKLILILAVYLVGYITGAVATDNRCKETIEQKA